MKFKEFPIISTMKRVWISYAHVTFAHGAVFASALAATSLQAFSGSCFFNGLKYMDNLQLSTKP